MLDILASKPQKIILIGDNLVLPETMENAIKSSKINCGKIKKIYWDWGITDEKVLGDPDLFSIVRAEQQLKIERNGPNSVPYSSELDSLISDADIIFTHFCPIPRELIEKGKNLKAIITCRGGLEHICIKVASESNIPVINTIRNATSVAEFALGMILALTRNIVLSNSEIKKGRWPKSYQNVEYCTTLPQLTIGLAGIGNIGIELAIRLKALGAKVIAYDEYISKERLEKNGLGDITLVPTLEDLFKQSDVVSLHLRLTEDTFKLIDKKYFSLMKPTSYFINTARGGLVDQEDLIEALKSNSIAGAALDVFYEEPIDPNSELIRLDNVILTSHIAGTTVESLPKSPFVTTREIEKIITQGIADRIVNFNDIEI